MKKFLLLTLSLISSFPLLAQVTFNGNGNSSFGGAIGGSTLQVSDDGTTITFVLTKGVGDLNDALVLYLDTKTGGRTVIDNDVNDTSDGLRTAISNGNSSGFASTITFPSGFGVDYAIALDQNFGGLWEIQPLGIIDNVNTLNYLTAVNLSPTGTNTSATYTFDVDWSELGLANTDSFTFVGLYVSHSAWNSDEGYGDGITLGSSGSDPVVYTSVFEYPSGNVLDIDKSTSNFASAKYSNNSVIINGLQGKVTIKVYDVLGKLIIDKQDIISSNQYSTRLDLPKNQLHILMVEGNNFKKVLKIISQ